MEEQGGGRLFRYYPSLAAAVMALYPEHNWDVSRFVDDVTIEYPSGQNLEKHKKLMNRIAQHLNVNAVSAESPNNDSLCSCSHRIGMGYPEKN